MGGKGIVTIPFDIRRRVFLRGPNWVGDAIMATPAIGKLRRSFPESHITLMVRPWVAAIYEHNPDINELWVQDDSTSTRAFFSAVNRVRKGQFDMGIAFPNSFRSAALMALGQIRHRVGYARGGRSFLLTRKVEVEPKLLEEHQVYYYLHLIEWMSNLPPEPPKMTLVPDPAQREWVTGQLRDMDCDPSRLRVGVAPGSINSMAKRWLPDRFVALIDRIKADVGAEIFLIGSSAEKDVLDDIAAQCKPGVHNLAAQFNLAQFIAFMDRLHAFIGNDSGAMHVAAALEVPTIAIFGPTDWRTTAPFTSRSKIVRHPVECSPCMLRTCPIAHPCMTGIEVEDVVRAFAELAPQIKTRLKGTA